MKQRLETFFRDTVHDGWAARHPHAVKSPALSFGPRLQTDIEPVLERLGLQEYLDVFVAEGFDTWEILSDIQESDLEHLNVKLGHRRKLQRAIADSRGWGSDKPLGSPLQEVTTTETQKVEGPAHDSGLSKDHPSSAVTEQKRKYRRHPKQDENAPEKPPSAYVLFSNKVREEVKAENLTFTEIARLVGERWQKLDPAQKDLYESHATSLKDTYNSQLAEYKKTDAYQEYAQYLADFKAKHSNTHEQKRPKLQSEKSSSLSAVSAISATSQVDVGEAATVFASHTRGGSIGSSSVISHTGPPAMTIGAQHPAANSLTYSGTPTSRRPSPPYPTSHERRILGHFSSQSSVSEESSSTRTDHGDTLSRAATLSLTTPTGGTPPPSMIGQGPNRTDFAQAVGYSPLSGRRPFQPYAPVASGLSPVSNITPLSGGAPGGDWWRERGQEASRPPFGGGLAGSMAQTGQPSSSLPISQLVASSHDSEPAITLSRRALPPLRQMASTPTQGSFNVLNTPPSQTQSFHSPSDLTAPRHGPARELPNRPEHEAGESLVGLPDRRSKTQQPWMPRSQPEERR